MREAVGGVLIHREGKALAGGSGHRADLRAAARRSGKAAGHLLQEARSYGEGDMSRPILGPGAPWAALGCRRG